MPHFLAALLLAGLSVIAGCNTSGSKDAGPGAVGKTFASPQAAVPAIRQMLKAQQWGQLAEYYDLSNSPLKPADLASGNFFISRDTTATAQPTEVTRYKHPFAPPAELQSLIRTADPDVVVLEMVVKIDQGAGSPVQRAVSWFMMKRVAGGWKILPDTPTQAQTQGERFN